MAFIAWLRLSLLAVSIFTQPGACQSTDGSCSNGMAYTPVGLGFNVTCNSWIYNYSGSTYVQERTSWEQCIEMCSVSRYVCYGAQFNATNSTCWFFNDPAYSYENSITAVEGLHTSLVPAWELKVNSTYCGFSNGQASVNGNDWEIQCNDTMPGGDMHELGEPEYAYHADSLEECMGFCLEVHPLCKAVEWDPTMPQGYANCRLKDLNATDLIYLGSPPFLGHVASVVLNTLEANCTGDTVSTSEGLSFNTLCNLRVGSGNMTALHTDTLGSCIASCSTNSSCAAVNWNFAMDQGWNNCYLLTVDQNISATADESSSFHAAVLKSEASAGASVGAGQVTTLSSSTLPSTAPTSSSSTAMTTAASATGDANHNTSTSKAWIAGPIVGGVAAMALGAGILYLCSRKRRAVLAATPEESPADQVAAQMTFHDIYSQPLPLAPPPEKLTYAGAIPTSLKHKPPVELYGDRPPVTEMATSPGRSDDSHSSYVDDDSTLHAR